MQRQDNCWDCPAECGEWYRCFSSCVMYVRIWGSTVSNKVWWNFLGSEVGGSAKMRDVCWWGLREDQSGWPVSSKN